MSDRIIFLVLGAAITFFLAAINFRLGVLKELKEDFKSFKEKVFEIFMTKDSCELTRKACDRHKK